MMLLFSPGKRCPCPCSDAVLCSCEEALVGIMVCVGLFRGPGGGGVGARDPMYDGRMPWSFLRHWIGRMLKTPAWCLWGSQREVFAAGLCGRHSLIVELNGGPSRAHCGPCKCLLPQLTYSATDLPCLVWRLREAMALEEALEAMALLRLEPIRTNPGPAMLQIHKVGATPKPPTAGAPVTERADARCPALPCTSG